MPYGNIGISCNFKVVGSSPTGGAISKLELYIKLIYISNTRQLKNKRVKNN